MSTQDVNTKLNEICTGLQLMIEEVLERSEPLKPTNEAYLGGIYASLKYIVENHLLEDLTTQKE